VEDGLGVEEAIKAKTLLEVEVKVGVETKKEWVGVILTCNLQERGTGGGRDLAIGGDDCDWLLWTPVLPIVFP